MKELKNLVRRLITGEISYAQFRREMVVQFLSSRNDDPVVEYAAYAVEAECADYSEGLFDLAALKNRLSCLMGQVDNATTTDMIESSEIQMFVIPQSMDDSDGLYSVAESGQDNDLPGDPPEVWSVPDNNFGRLEA